ncbi:sensor histidine kinase [Actinomyces oricola]
MNRSGPTGAPPTTSGPAPREGTVAEGRGRARWSWWRWAVALGILAAMVAVSALLWGDLRVTMSVSVPLLVGEVLGLGAGAAAAVLLLRHRWGAAQQRAAARAQESARARHRQFLRRLDHELKNPLTAVRVAVADASRVEDRAKAASSLEVVDAQARRMSRLLTDLRKLAELETSPLSLEEVDLAETLRDAVAAVQEDGAARGAVPPIRVDLPQVPWPLPAVRGDGDLLYSALCNVVSNAVKYTPPSGVIEVRGREEAGVVTIEVADTGIGVPEADLPAVWSELARAGNARALPGSGLGLALVSTIVERHRGRVRMTSREGVGTRVWLSLPVAGP